MIQLILGNVPFLKDRALASVRAAHQDQEPESYFGPELKAKTLMQTTRNLSLLGDSPFIIVRALDQMPKKERDKLLGSWSDVPDDVSLVLLADKADRRQKFWQELVKAADLLSAEAPEARDRRAWFQTECRRRSLDLAPDAGNVLGELGGVDFNQTLLLLEKLEIFLNGRKEVSLEDLSACQSGGMPAKIFDWVDAVGSADWRRVFTLLQVLWANQESPLPMLALLVRHYRILLKALENKGLWGRSQDLAKILGVPPFVVERYVAQAKRFQRQELLATWELLQETDRSLKSSPVPKQIELEALLWSLRRQRLQPAV